MAEEDNFDIYGDLNEFDASVKLKEVSQELEGLKKKHEDIQKSLETSEAVTKHLKAVVGTVKKNFYVLLNTARTEVKRKDGTIAQLRRDFDDMAFRRTKTRGQRMDKSTQTEQDREDSGRRRDNGSLMSERGRRTRYDRFRESVTKDQGQKRRRDGDREPLNDPKRRRSRPRSPSRDRNRRESNRRYRDRSPERHSQRRDPKSQRRSREKSEKVETKQTNSKGKAKDLPKIEEVQEKEDKSNLDTKNDLPEPPEQKLTTPQKIEKIYQETREETLAAVENILRETASMPEENLTNGLSENPPLPPQEDPVVPPPPPPSPPPVPQEEPKPPEIPEDQPNSSDQADSSKETQNVSINMGNSDYSIQKDNQGVVTVFIKRKKRKSK
ncbi:serine/threonine-protein kinase fray2-like [Phlebotomus papatasi]|uniref:serine/threonine-protein kinase fray2-like n=1 Tax=Phlebotomus papatasi TaxID=29031 RepID=UPI002483481B|nr:serine/threonine-protein kinase fray2-like [Phlebotomus papatasi]